MADGRGAGSLRVRDTGSTPSHVGARAEARIEALDGLRALSILIVLFGHAARSRGAPAWLWPGRDLGILGVYLFFAISGYVITLLMLRERARSGRVCLRRFWTRRALRILPPFALACAGIGAAAGLGLMAWHWPALLSALTFTRNTPLFRGDWFFGHFWSLSTEEQFYLFWPLLFALLAPCGTLTQALLGLVLLSPALELVSQAHYPLFDGNLPCVPYLALGCLLAAGWRARDPRLAAWRERRALRLVCLLALPPCAIAIQAMKRDADPPTAIAALSAGANLATIFVVLFETLAPDGRLRGVLARAPLRALGLASYSIYLWQQLFLGPPEVYSHAWYWNAWPQNLIAACAAGFLAYGLVEWPLLRLRRRLSASRS